VPRRERRDRPRQLTFDDEVGIERVLDDKDARGRARRGQLRPPPGRREEPGRVLEVGNRVEKLRAFPENAGQGGWLGPLRVEGDAEKPGAVRAEERKGAGVARALHGHGVAGIDERSRNQVEPLLRPVDDEDASASAGMPRRASRAASVSRSGR